MAEEVYGQPTRMEEIQEKLLMMAEFQDEELIDLNVGIDSMHETLIEMKVSQDMMDEYQSQQQGQEVAYSRWSQLHQEKTRESLEADETKGGRAKEDTAEESKDYLSELKKTAILSLKNQVKTAKEDSQKWLENKAQFSNFTGALKNDLNLFTGKLQLLTQLPGVTTLLTAIKMSLATIALWILRSFPWIGKIAKAVLTFFGGEAGAKLAKSWGLGSSIDEKKKQMGELVKDPGEWKAGVSDPGGAKYRKWKEQKDLFDKQQEDIKEAEGYWGGTKKNMGKLKKKLDDGANSLHKGAHELANYLQRSWSGTGGLKDKIKSNFGAIGNTVKNLTETMGDAVKEKFSQGADSMKKGFAWLGDNLKDVAGNLKDKGMLLVKSIKTGLVRVFGMIAGAIAGITAPVWLIIAALLLVAIGLWYFWDEIRVGWENTKQWFSDAVDTVKSWGPKIKNWFTELGEDITYNIQWFIAKIKDGILSMANSVIDKINWLPGVDIEKFEVNNVEGVDADYQKVLAARNPREAQENLIAAEDSKDAAEFVNRMMEGKSTAPVVNQVNNNTTSTSHFTGKSQPRDSFLRTQNEVR